MTEVHALFIDREAVTSAVASAKSRRHALILLGLRPGAANYQRLTAACQVYGLTVPPPFGADRDRTEKKCNGCNRALPIERFAWKDESTGRRQSRCRECHSGLRRDHYIANKAKILKQVDRRNRLVRKENIARVVEYLVDHPCVDCGEADPVVLHFDHVDPSTKRMSIARLILQATWAKVLEEIAKCEVRCANCHQRRTAGQFGWLRAALAQQHAVVAHQAENQQ